MTPFAPCSACGVDTPLGTRLCPCGVDPRETADAEGEMLPHGERRQRVVNALPLATAEYLREARFCGE